MYFCILIKLQCGNDVNWWSDVSNDQFAELQVWLGGDKLGVVSGETSSQSAGSSPQ